MTTVKHRGPEPMIVLVRGQSFASPAECARHFGVSINTVYGALACGRADGIGLGRGRNQRGRAGSRHRFMTDIPGCEGMFQEQASVHLGFHPKYLAKARARARQGQPSMWERAIVRAMQMSAAAAQRRITDRNRQMSAEAA